MLTILRAILNVINAILHLVAITIVTGGTILIAAIVILLVAGAVLGLSSLGAFSLVRRKRHK
jgi:hypothetical protein